MIILVIIAAMWGILLVTAALLAVSPEIALCIWEDKIYIFTVVLLIYISRKSDRIIFAKKLAAISFVFLIINIFNIFIFRNGWLIDSAVIEEYCGWEDNNFQKGKYVDNNGNEKTIHFIYDQLPSNNLKNKEVHFWYDPEKAAPCPYAPEITEYVGSKIIFLEVEKMIFSIILFLTSVVYFVICKKRLFSGNSGYTGD